MSPSQNENEERKTLLIRFVVFYAICILCITVPLYYLFDIPDLVLSKLNNTKPQNNNEQVMLDSIQSIIKKLDGYLNESKYENEYKNGYFKLFNYANDSLKSEPHKTFLLKVSKLYEEIEKTFEKGGKDEIEKLKKENEEKDLKIQETEEDLKKCEIDYGILLGKPKSD